MSSITQSATTYEIRFESLFRPGRALAFPCDESGQVDLDAVSESLRDHYLFARAMVGREYSWPQLRATAWRHGH